MQLQLGQEKVLISKNIDCWMLFCLMNYDDEEEEDESYFCNYNIKCYCI